ncbi:MAG: hypothetical protein IPJ81_15565 [Chitinophagaceae bacterium]|nr:hypothetical protein [Chitinophagaceae bacterium]
MNIEKINTIPYKPGILIDPLDWGLGHATRCIPLINELLTQHYEVIIAASGASAALLKKRISAVTNYNNKRV